MDEGEYLGDEFSAKVIAALGIARDETLKAGIPIFYRDPKTNVSVMELPEGRRFEVHLIRGVPREQSVEILREINQTAA